MLQILDDPETTGVCIVTTPEETPVNEAAELAERLGAETRVALAAVVANRVLPELFGRAEEELFQSLSEPGRRARLAAALGREPVHAVAEVLEAARLAVQIRRRGAGHLERLRAALPAVPIYYVPYLFGRAHGPRAIRQVAAALGEELGY
jgi:anion-transporting  ArsA/GET3 family ATPase